MLINLLLNPLTIIVINIISGLHHRTTNSHRRSKQHAERSILSRIGCALLLVFLAWQYFVICMI